MVGSRGWVILAAISLARVGFGYQFQAVASIGPDLMTRFHLGYAGLGSLIGVYMAAGALVALPLGLLARRFGDGLILGGGLALMAVGGLLSAVLGGPAGIAFGRLIAGIGAVALTVLQGKVIADLFPGPRFMLAISISVGAYPVGIGIAQIVAPPLDVAFGWPAAFLPGAAAMALVAILFAAAYRPVPGALDARPAFSMPGIGECWLLLVAGFIWTAYTAGYAGYLSYTPSLMAARGEGLLLTGIVMALATWGNVAGTLVGGALADRFGPRWVFVLGTVLATIAIAGMAVLDWPIVWGTLLGFPGSIQSGVIVAIGTLSARPQNRAAGMGIFYTLYYLGNAIIPALCGRAADLTGSPAGAFYAAAFVSALALPAYLLHRRLSSGEAMLARA